jgi:RNA polymerase sigma-70 factor (ECF subfamily)
MTTSQRPDRPAGCDQDQLIAMIPQMRAFAGSLCHDPSRADDLAQDALASAWRRRDSYTPGTNLRAWLFMIIRNQFYSDKRRAWRMTQLDPKAAEETLVTETNPTAALELDDLRRALLALTDEQRQALTLIGVAGLGYADAAMVCHCAEGTIKSRVSRARQRLTAILAKGELVGDRRVPGQAMAMILADAARVAAA